MGPLDAKGTAPRLMRIGMFNASLPEAHRKPGGVEVFVDRLAVQLCAEGHEVVFFSYSPRPPGAPYEHRQMRPEDWKLNKLAQALAVPLHLNLLDTRGLDVLHLHGDDWLFLRRRLPTVRTFYGSAWHEAMSATRLRRRVFMGGVSAGELVASLLATRTYGIIPGHPSSLRLNGSLKLGADLLGGGRPVEERAGPPAVLFVGTWHGRKRGRLLWEVFRNEVGPSVPEAELWMVSDRCQEADGVTWIPRPSDTELADLMGRAWVFCMPSTYEGFGLPYLEAMSRGTPVIASPNLGAMHVLDGGRAGLVPEDGELGRDIVRCLTDGHLRARLGRLARARAETFSWPEIVKEHLAAYHDAVEARARRRGHARR